MSAKNAHLLREGPRGWTLAGLALVLTSLWFVIHALTHLPARTKR